MAPRTKTGATNARTAKTSDSPAAKPQEQAAQAPAQPAQVKPASDPTPAGANTLGKVLPETAPAPKSTLQKIQDRVAADWQEAARQKAARNAGKTQAQINRESMAELIDMVPIGGRLGGGLRGGAKPNAPRNTPASPAPAPAPKPTTTPAPAPPPANATARTANGSGGGYSKARVKQNPHKDCGKKLPYSDRDTLKNTGLKKDHTPSSKAIYTAAMEKMKPLIAARRITKDAAEKIAHTAKENAPTIAIPHDVHVEGNTYGSKNKPLYKQDAGDLNGAAKRDTKAISEAMADKKHGCSDAYNKAAAEITNMDWDKYVDDAIKKGMKGR